MSGLGRFAVLASALALAVPAFAQAGNVVSTWNEIAVNTVVAQPPISSSAPPAGVFMAMVQGAVYGAVNATDRHGKPYLVNRSFPKASTDAAAATAAYRVLAALFPSASLDTAYAASLQAIAPGASRDQGIEVGTMAANAMLAQGHDSRTVIPCSFGTGAAGEWMPLAAAPGVPACDPNVWVAYAKPFVLSSPYQFRGAGPYPLSSPQYAADYNEVKLWGSVNSTKRLPDQTHAAVFWQTNPAVGYNALARRFVDQFSLGVADSARLFAMIDLSAADAIITAWNDKYYFNFWRPITAIHYMDDGNAGTDPDPSWTPLFNPGLAPAIAGSGPPLSTPPYPDYLSGATTYASATMHALASYFGTDDIGPFYLTSSRFPGEHRPFTRFSAVTNEILEARIWAGIHFRHADEDAATLGRTVERYVSTHIFASQ